MHLVHPNRNSNCSDCVVLCYFRQTFTGMSAITFAVTFTSHSFQLITWLHTANNFLISTKNESGAEKGCHDMKINIQLKASFYVRFADSERGQWLFCLILKKSHKPPTCRELPVDDINPWRKNYKRCCTLIPCCRVRHYMSDRSKETYWREALSDHKNRENG